MPYYVYVILCEDGSYYTGYAKDIYSRVKRHVRGIGARYTKLHRPKKLVYIEEFDTRREAMRREREIKKLGHDDKHKLVSPLTIHVIFRFMSYLCYYEKEL